MPTAALAILSLSLAPAPFPRPYAGKADLARLQGAWVFAFSVQGGKQTPAEQKVVWTVQGSRVTPSLDGKKMRAFDISLDARKRPKAIDITSPGEKRDPAPGRYSLEGDLLKVCVGVGTSRPADLSGAGTRSGLWVFRRLKR
jgi:uncharacterized protein (TIGR03067 family)